MDADEPVAVDAAETVAETVAEQRFRAEIRRQGPNPYVDVPAPVSAALASHARAGRVPVEGTVRQAAEAAGAGAAEAAGVGAAEGPVREAAFRATLIPVGSGRQRLHLPGGVRAAAGVGVGDTVEITVHAVGPDEVTVPADLAAALAAAEARGAFDALTAAHRRQLLRFVDDARTPATRAKRVGQVVDQALGRPAAASPASAGRALWTCPVCGNQFVNRNQYHSCGTYQIDDCFRGRPPEIRALFDAFRAMVEAVAIRAGGPVTTVAYRDAVGFMVDVRFAQAAPRQRWLDVGFWLSRRVESPRFWKVETIYPYAHIHVLRVTAVEQLDGEVAGWLREAYAVGRREHLSPSPRTSGATRGSARRTSDASREPSYRTGDASREPPRHTSGRRRDPAHWTP